MIKHVFRISAAASIAASVALAADGPQVVPLQKVIADNRMMGVFDVIAADMDGDDDMDIVTAARESHMVAWYENDGKGAFTLHDISGANAMDGPRTVAAGDLDGDGDMDTAAAALEGGEVAWWRNDGNAHVKLTIAAPGTLAGARSLRISDLDGDGDADVICAASEADQIVWFQNDGAGNFTRRTVAGPGTLDQPYWLTAADMDGDGDADVAAIGRAAGEAAWWENDGTGIFTRHGISGAKAIDGPRAIDVADLDGDGDMDAVTAAGEGNDVAWWENTGSGLFARRDVSGAGAFDGARSVTVADLDGDGDTDLIGTARDGQEVAWWENDGAGNFTKRDISAVMGGVDGPYGTAVADMNGDGTLDVIVADWWDNDVVVWLMGRQ